MKLMTDWDILNSPLKTVKYRDYRLVGMSYETQNLRYDTNCYEWGYVNKSAYDQIYWGIDVTRYERNEQYCFRLKV